jgi:hypothetical protein
VPPSGDLRIFKGHFRLSWGRYRISGNTVYQYAELENQEIPSGLN